MTTMMKAKTSMSGRWLAESFFRDRTLLPSSRGFSANYLIIHSLNLSFMFVYLLTAASSVNAVWTPTPDWVSSWKQKLPLQTIMRMLQVLVPQVEKICIDKGNHGFFLSFLSLILSCFSFLLCFFLSYCLSVHVSGFLSFSVDFFVPALFLSHLRCNSLSTPITSRFPAPL